ncbi:MAG: L,D-transpeptidase family protein [Thermodesulfobacteriota bacterium]
MLNLGRFLLFLLLAIVLNGCGGKAGKPPEASLDMPLPVYEPQRTNLTAEQRYLEQVLNKKGYTNGSKPTVIVVHKLPRKLTLYRGITPLKTYKIVLGNDPYNDKMRQGDTCTPEGVYRVVCKYPHPKWTYFILLDYPNTQNWLKFGRAKKAGKVPLDADIGGAIGIHGTEDPYKNLSGQNWTKGCVSLLNQDLEEIYPLINNKTLVVIKKD